MIIRGGSPDGVHKLLKELFMPSPEHWSQIGKLKAEDMLRFRTQELTSARAARKARQHLLEVKALEAQAEVTAAKWWDYVRNTYSLPVAGNFHIARDGRILMAPRN